MAEFPPEYLEEILFFRMSLIEISTFCSNYSELLKNLSKKHTELFQVLLQNINKHVCDNIGAIKSLEILKYTLFSSSITEMIRILDKAEDSEEFKTENIKVYLHGLRAILFGDIRNYKIRMTNLKNEDHEILTPKKTPPFERGIEKFNGDPGKFALWRRKIESTVIPDENLDDVQKFLVVKDLTIGIGYEIFTYLASRYTLHNIEDILEDMYEKIKDKDSYFLYIVRMFTNVNIMPAYPIMPVLERFCVLLDGILKMAENPAPLPFKFTEQQAKLLQSYIISKFQEPYRSELNAVGFNFRKIHDYIQNVIRLVKNPDTEEAQRPIILSFILSNNMKYTVKL